MNLLSCTANGFQISNHDVIYKLCRMNVGLDATTFALAVTNETLMKTPPLPALLQCGHGS